MYKGLKHVGKKLAFATVAFGLFINTHTAFASDAYYTLANVNFRSEASAESTILALVPLGSEVAVDEVNEDGWSKISFEDMQGYMKSEYIGDQVQLDEVLKESQKPTVELTNWSEAKNLVRLGVPIKVYDIYTGITYYIKSFSNGKHADVEPITKEDTALMKKTYGGKWSWDPRAVWVTIDGKTMAASINGMPHGGGVNNNNGMDGQVCLHFKGSSTHNGNSSFTKLHQQKALEAYNLSK